MAMGPVEVLVIGFGEDAEFKGEALEELQRLREAEIVRLIDLLFVRKNTDGTVDKIELTDSEELVKMGAVAGALIGFGAAGEEGAEVGAVAGAAAMADGTLYDDAQIWYIADAIPEGTAAAIAVIEHRWAIPLRDAVRRAGGVALADEWIHPLDLIAAGIEAAEE
ncbi:MAG TPA: hypothetical protein VLN08_07145 [Vicinamibacterales bacterium]|nr:hypothetical protein [Vicinamibacterales bacterium]